MQVGDLAEDESSASVAPRDRVFTQQGHALIAALYGLSPAHPCRCGGPLDGAYLFELQATISVGFGPRLKAELAAFGVVGTLKGRLSCVFGGETPPLHGTPVTLGEASWASVAPQS